MKYLYIDNLAYPYALQSVYAAKGQWPEGKGVDIDEAIFREYFHDTPPEGKRRITAGDGMPAWAENTDVLEKMDCLHGQIFLHQHVKNKLHQPKLKSSN